MKEKESFIALEVYSIMVTGEYLALLREYEKGQAKYGETYGEEPKPPKAKYYKKYYNTSSYQIDNWSSSWDDEGQFEIIVLQWTHLESGQSEQMNLKMTEKEFIGLLPHFNAEILKVEPISYTVSMDGSTLTLGGGSPSDAVRIDSTFEGIITPTNNKTDE